MRDIIAFINSTFFSAIEDLEAAETAYVPYRMRRRVRTYKPKKKAIKKKVAR